MTGGFEYIFKMTQLEELYLILPTERLELVLVEEFCEKLALNLSHLQIIKIGTYLLN